MRSVKAFRPRFGVRQGVTSYLECLDEIPPPLCRLIARTAMKPWGQIMTIPQIAAVAGLHWRKVAWIARQKSFARITVAEADKFRLGCGITLANERKQREYIKRNFNRGTAWRRLFEASMRNLPPAHRNRFLRRVRKALDNL